MDVIAAIVILGLGLAGFWQSIRDPRVDRAFWARSLRVILGYLVFVAAGLMLMVLLGLGGSSTHQLGVWLFLLGWFGLAFIWLVRLAPSLKPGPAPEAPRWGLIDWVLLAFALAGAGTALLTRPVIA